MSSQKKIEDKALGRVKEIKEVEEILELRKPPQIKLTNQKKLKEKQKQKNQGFEQIETFIRNSAINKRIERFRETINGINGLEGFGTIEFMRKAAPDVLRLMRKNRQRRSRSS